MDPNADTVKGLLMFIEVTERRAGTMRQDTRRTYFSWQETSGHDTETSMIQW